ncbi:transmembrane protein 176 [Nelusetta ayraudi]|uniref:transmembrane protein 176 n=1 Tax=Nelusetta ayraudi TaxID=303726 RepID=UPI003F72A3BE
MAVQVSGDLNVQVLQDVNINKLAERQQALQVAIQRGEPKSLGVSQVMLGLMVLSYSIPLCFIETTEVVDAGVPWWSSLTFIAAGIIAIVLDKVCNEKLLVVCLTSSVVSLLVSAVAGIIYCVDLDRNPVVSCGQLAVYEECSDQHYTTRLSRGLKGCLLLFTLVQTVVSAVLCGALFRQRRGFRQYASLAGPDL